MENISTNIYFTNFNNNRSRFQVTKFLKYMQASNLIEFADQHIQYQYLNFKVKKIVILI